MHVFAQNEHCDEWNAGRLVLLPGTVSTSVASDGKKDDCAQLATVNMPERPRETGNLRKILQVKVGARVMITTNIDVSDGLTNGAMGFVSNIVMDTLSQDIKAILVVFDNSDVGEDARSRSLYKHINANAVPITYGQKSFQLKNKKSCQVTRKQFPLTLAWAVTIHKCQGLTLQEIVVDMCPSKGQFSAGQAYVAFSRVCELCKLHIVNYTRTQIRVSPNVANEMARLRKNVLPTKPHLLFHTIPTDISIIHLNIGGIHRKMPDIQHDDILKLSDIICLNETHRAEHDPLNPQMMNIMQDVSVFRCDRNHSGGGVALIVNNKLNPIYITVDLSIELVAVKICALTEMIIISVYRPPATPICQFTYKMTHIAKQFANMPTCILGDINEDIALTSEKQCCSTLKFHEFTQMVTKPTRDSGTLLDHVYVTSKVSITTDENDCYYSDHDYVLCSIHI